MTDHTTGKREPSAPSRGSVEENADVRDSRTANTTDHDAVPAAITVSDEDRTDKAATSHRRDRSGDTPVAACSVAERPLGDPEIAVEILRLRVAELEEAIRRLAEQDATLSLLCKRDGSQVVTVTMDATLTDAEREAIWFFAAIDSNDPVLGSHAATLRALLERIK